LLGPPDRILPPDSRRESERQMNGRFGTRSSTRPLNVFYASDRGGAQYVLKETTSMTFLNTLKVGSRAAITVLVIGAATLSAAPAQAQNFQFDFGIGGGGGGGGANLSFRGGDDDDRRYRPRCLDKQDVRRGLRRADFEEIRFVSENRRRFKVIAEYDPNNRRYSMTVDRCSGEVYDIERVRRGNRPDDDFNIR
jgi:hypothetical protein